MFLELLFEGGALSLQYINEMGQISHGMYTTCTLNSIATIQFNSYCIEKYLVLKTAYSPGAF